MYLNWLLQIPRIMARIPGMENNGLIISIKISHLTKTDVLQLYLSQNDDNVRQKLAKKSKVRFVLSELEMHRIKFT